MHNAPELARRTAVLLLAALAAAAGCSKKMWIYQTPAFYSPDLKNIAVVPFRNHTSVRNAGNVVADNLAAALMDNPTYKIFARNDLKMLLDQEDLRRALSGEVGPGTSFGKMVNVQAFLAGSVTMYSATSSRQFKKDPVYGYNKRTKNRYIQGYRSYYYTRNEANVSVSAALIRPDGTTIHATGAPVHAREVSEGESPRMDRYACAAVATDRVIRRLVEEFAVIRRQIKINPGKALRTAADLYDNQWTYTKKFKPTDDKMFVVVALPPACDRNPFRLVIVRKDQREELASLKFVWSRNRASFGYRFSPRRLAAAGTGEYEVKFYSGPEPIMRRAFKIEPGD